MTEDKSLLTIFKDRYIDTEVWNKTTWVDRLSIGITGITALGYTFVTPILCGTRFHDKTINVITISLTSNNITKFLFSLFSAIKHKFTAVEGMHISKIPKLSWPCTLFYSESILDIFLVTAMISDIYFNIFKFCNKYNSSKRIRSKTLTRIFMITFFGAIYMIDQS